MMSIPTALQNHLGATALPHDHTWLEHKESGAPQAPAPTMNRTLLQGCSTRPWRKRIYMGTKTAEQVWHLVYFKTAILPGSSLLT